MIWFNAAAVLGRLSYNRFSAADANMIPPDRFHVDAVFLRWHSVEMELF